MKREKIGFGSENSRWAARIFFAVAMAVAASAGLSLAGFKGSPVLFGGGWVTENSNSLPHG
jgi:hypothetical protein